MMRSVARLEAEAPAKINLYLHIVGRQADGYHLLESLVGFTRACDRICAEPAQGLDLHLGGPFAPELSSTAAQDNLVLRAAHELAVWATAQSRTPGGAALRLEKNLPVASGIGGGSADAAATLKVLARLWDLPSDAQILSVIAARLGADVPACLEPRTIMMEGTGALIAPLAPLPEVPLLLVNPGLPLATPSVYRAFRESRAIHPAPRPKPVGPWRDAEGLAADLALTANDLEAPATDLCPAIGEILVLLRQHGALLARMSGSGATCFGLFKTDLGAQDAAAAIRAARPSWWVMPTSFRSAL